LLRGDILPWLLLSNAATVLPQGSWNQPTAMGFFGHGRGLAVGQFKAWEASVYGPLQDGHRPVRAHGRERAQARMRIVIFTHPPFLGSTSMPLFADMIARGVAEHGHEVERWTPKALFHRLPARAV